MLEAFIVVGLIIQAAVEIFVIVWIARTAAATKRTAELLATLHSLPGDVGAIRRHLEAQQRAAAEVVAATPADGAVFDRTLIPVDRFYAKEGNLSTRLTQAGLVTRAQLDRAREEMARAGGGGHLCDYLIGLGYLEVDSLRVILGRA